MKTTIFLVLNIVLLGSSCAFNSPDGDRQLVGNMMQDYHNEEDAQIVGGPDDYLKVRTYRRLDNGVIRGSTWNWIPVSTIINKNEYIDSVISKNGTR